jgi:hypothetical protein
MTMTLSCSRAMVTTDQWAVKPPSTVRRVPVAHRVSFEPRKTAALAAAYALSGEHWPGMPLYRWERPN